MLYTFSFNDSVSNCFMQNIKSRSREPPVQSDEAAVLDGSYGQGVLLSTIVLNKPSPL